MPDIKEILQEYVATANNPEYKSDFKVINSKFPELKGYDPVVLEEYVATANNPKYKSDFGVINSKFPELFSEPEKKKDISFGYSTPQEAITSKPLKQPSPLISNTSQSKLPSASPQTTKEATSKITPEQMDVPVEASKAIALDRQAEKDLELKKQMVYNDMRFARLLDKKQSQDRGYKNIEDYYKDRESFLINNYLSEDDKEEARANNAFLEAKKMGNEKLASEELQNLLNAKANFRKKINDERSAIDDEEAAIRKGLESGMPQDAFDASMKVLNKKRADLDLMSKPYYDPKKSMEQVLSDNITEVAAVSKPSQTAEEKLREYTNALYTQLNVMRDDLGWDADNGALDAYAKDFQLRKAGKGELVDKMYETELKLRNAVKILELNRTPIEAESGLGVIGKSFATAINPASASKMNTQQVIANNLQEINEGSQISEAVNSEQKKFAEETAKPYEPYSQKWFAQPLGASTAIMLEFIPASLATEGIFAATKLGKLINIAEKYGKIKGLNTTSKYIDAVRKYKTANVGDKIGKLVLKTQANGVKFGTTSEIVAQLFPNDADEVNFTTGYFGGQIGKGAEQLLGGAGISIMKLFGNKAPEAVKAIERLGEQFKFAKDAPKTIIGEIGEEFGESLGQIYRESDSWTEIKSKLDEQFGTLDKATQFAIQTGIMALGMGGGTVVGTNLMKSSKEAYNKLNREQRAIVDEVLDSVTEEEKNIENSVTKSVEEDIVKNAPQAKEQIETITNEVPKSNIVSPTDVGQQQITATTNEAPNGGIEGPRGELEQGNNGVPSIGAKPTDNSSIIEPTTSIDETETTKNTETEQPSTESVSVSNIRTTLPTNEPTTQGEVVSEVVTPTETKTELSSETTTKNELTETATPTEAVVKERTPLTISTNKDSNIQNAKEILKEHGIDASFSGYSDTNGVSVYFTDAKGNKIRVSNHSVTSKHRLENEVHLYFDAKQMGVGGKKTIKSYFDTNKKNAQNLFNEQAGEGTGATKEGNIEKSTVREYSEGDKVGKTESPSDSNRLLNEKEKRKKIAEAKIDEVADLLKDFLPSTKGVKKSGIGQDEIIDLIAKAVKSLVNTGIDIQEAIKQVKERLSERFDVDDIKDFDIKMNVAKNDLKPLLEKEGITYRQAIFTVNKYLREVGKEDVITEDELKEALKIKKEKGEVRESGRSKSYEEERVPVSEEYRKFVDKNKASYTAMDMFQNADKAIELLETFGGTEKGLQKAYDYFIDVYDTNPYLNPANAVAIELLSDRLFAKGNEVYKNGDTEQAEKYFNQSNTLRLRAFNAATVAGQYNAALAVFARSVNPDAFLYFVNKEVEKANTIDESNTYSNTVKKVKKEKAQKETKEFKKKAKDIATTTANDVAKNIADRKGRKPNERFSKLKERGVQRQKDALDKLKRLGYLGSSGLNNEAIEAIGELVLSQLEIGIYKAATIVQKIKAMTDGRVTDEHLKEVLDTYKATYEGKEYSLSELSEVLEKEYKKENVESELKKRVEGEVKNKKGEPKKSLSDLVKMQLSENANVDTMAKEIMNEFDVSEQVAQALASKYVSEYKRLLTERIHKELQKSLGIKNVKEIEKRENSGEFKPYEKTLGGKIVGEIMAGALDSGSAISDAFAQKYGFPVLTPTMQNNIRLLSAKANEAKTFLGQKVANRALITYLQSILPTSTTSVLNTVYYVSLLSGVTTAAVNTIGNSYTLVNQNAENFIQSIIEATKGEPANLISTVNGKAKLKRSLTNFNNAITTFLNIMQKGGGESKYYNLNQKALDSFDSERLIARKEDFKNLGLKRLAQVAGKIWYTAPAFINRNLPASDDAFSLVNFNLEAAREVRKELAKSGLKGSELEDAVYQRVYGTPEIQANAIIEAKQEVARIGIDPASDKRLVKRIAFEIIQNNLDTKVQNTARALAAENTYRGVSRGLTGYIGSLIPQNVVLAPFVTTVMKIAEKMVNYIPFYGIQRASGFGLTDIIRKSSSSVDKAFARKGIDYGKRTREMRNKQIAQVVLSHAVLMTAYALTKVGWVDPEDGEEKPLLEFSGGYLGVSQSKREKLEKEMPMYTMRFMGTKINYTQNPLLAMIGVPLSINADLKRAGKEELSAADLELYFKVAMATSIYILNATPVQNIQQFFSTLGKSMDETSDTDVEDVAKQFVRSFGGQAPANIAIPNTYKQLYDFYDHQKFDVNTVEDALWKSFNMERIGELEPSYDWWGRDIKQYPAERTYPLRDVFSPAVDPVDKWGVKNDITIPNLNRKTLVLDLESARSYTKKAYDKKIAQEAMDNLDEYGDSEIESEANYKLLTQHEWAEMDKTVRQKSHDFISDNLDKIKTKEYGELYLEKPFNKMTKKEAESAIRLLFKQQRMDYIHKNFKTEK